jgi:RNA polymerase sigma-70 factor (ECF subfamily)
MRAGLAEVRFQELYRTYQHQVLAYFLRRTDTASARDGTAETFLVVWRRIDDVPDGAELPWMYGIARRVLANLRRSQRRYDALERKVQRTAVTENPTPETVVIRRFEDEEMLSAIGRLRPEDQEVLLLSVWEELPNRAIASVLRTSPNAISQRMRRITKQLAHELNHPRRRSGTPAASRFLEGGGWK